MKGRFIPQWWREYDIRGGRLKNPTAKQDKHEPTKETYSDTLENIYTELYRRIDNIGLYKRGHEVLTSREFWSRVRLYMLAIVMDMISTVYVLVITPAVATYIIGLVLYTLNDTKFYSALSFLLKELQVK
jgi:hypothetical protein